MKYFYLLFLLMSSQVYASQTNDFINLNLPKIHQNLRNHCQIKLKNGQILSLKPLSARVYKESRFQDSSSTQGFSQNVRKWQYPLELELAGPELKMMYDDPIPAEEELKLWSSFQGFYGEIFIDEQKIGSTQFDIHHFNKDLQEDPFLYFINIVIEAPFQNKGYGSAFVEEIVGKSLKKIFPFIKRIEVVIDSENPQAAEIFHKKAAFTLSAEALEVLHSRTITPESYFQNCTQSRNLCLIKTYE